MKGIQVLGERYVVGEFLGAGGMGMVYRADDRATHDRVAIKIARARFRRDPIVIRHFHREALVGARLSHPGIVSVRDTGTLADTTPFLVMDLVDGRPLKALLGIEGLWSLGRIARLFAQLLDGLHGLHAEGFVHADVKPENVLVQSHGETDTATLIDLGLAHVAGERERGDPVVSGTPEYMAPEVIAGHAVVPASDLYAAGVMLYELLTGTTPFGGASTAEILRRHLEDPIVPPSVRCPDLAIPKALDDITLRALARRPEARYASARGFADALARAVATCDATALRARPCFSTVARTLASAPVDTPRSVAVLHATRRARTSLGRCLREGDADRIASSTLELVGLLVASHRLYEASCTLDRTIHLLTGGEGPEATQGPAALWRLLLVLAGICDGRREHVRARQLARAALHHATRAESRTGTFRVRELLDRFSGRAVVAR